MDLAPKQSERMIGWGSVREIVRRLMDVLCLVGPGFFVIFILLSLKSAQQATWVLTTLTSDQAFPLISVQREKRQWTANRRPQAAVRNSSLLFVLIAGYCYASHAWKDNYRWQKYLWSSHCLSKFWIRGPWSSLPLIIHPPPYFPLPQA